MLALIVDGEYRYTTFEKQAAEWPDGTTVIPFDGCCHPKNENWFFRETVHSDIDPTKTLKREYIDVVAGQPIVKYEYESRSLKETLDEYVDWIETFTNELTGHIPQTEKDGWVNKGHAAEAYLANTATVAQKSMIEIEAGLTGEDPVKLSEKIINKLLEHARISATIAGYRRKTEMELEFATPEQYESIVSSMKQKLQDAVKGNN